jgi:hypothetical protein
MMRVLLVVGITLGLACNGVTTPDLSDPPSPGDLPDVDVAAPLTELTGATYEGFLGGLYPGGANTVPSDHAAVGRSRAAEIQPLDQNGDPNPDGVYALLSVGMSNTTREFCKGRVTDCAPWSFVGQASADPTVDHEHLVLVDGAVGGHPASDWDSPDDPVYARVRDQRLAPLGLTEAQVQVAWIKQANPRPRVSLPAADADALQLEASLGDIVRALKVHYPNLQQVVVSSRTYGGYATTTLNPEPYAFETGFAVKWLVEAQIMQSRTGVIDSEAGDLSLDFGAPWLAWGPYLWADGENPRSDGLIWVRDDFVADGTHPSPLGEQKVGAMLLEFFKTSAETRCWFLAGESC